MFEQLKKSGVSGWFVVATHQSNQRRYATMSKNNVVKMVGRETLVDLLTELLRRGLSS